MGLRTTPRNPRKRKRETVLSLTKNDLIESNCKCGQVKKAVIPQVKAIEQARRQEQERILSALAEFQNPAWRKHYLEAITKIVTGG
jgi:hypothetical protein